MRKLVAMGVGLVGDGTLLHAEIVPHYLLVLAYGPTYKTHSHWLHGGLGLPHGTLKEPKNFSRRIVRVWTKTHI